MNKLILLILLKSLLISNDLDTSFNDGKSSASSIRTHFSSDFDSTISSPMNGTSSMSTVDGSGVFDGANSTCSTKNGDFISLSYAVDSLNEIEINLEIDMNLDAIPEMTSVTYLNEFSAVIPPKNISGVCTDGIISCDPGTWDNCGFYEWHYSGSQMVLAFAQRLDLASCQCTNNSCGGAATSMKRSVLDVLGAGIYNTFSYSNTSLIISRVENDGIFSKYYGQDASDCDQPVSYNSSSGESLSAQGYQANATLNSQPESAVYTIENSDYNQESTTIAKMNNFQDTEYDSSQITIAEGTDMQNRNSMTVTSVTSNDGVSSQSLSYSTNIVDENGFEQTISDSSTMYSGVFEEEVFCQVNRKIDSATVFSDGTNESQIANKTDMLLETKVCVNGICPLVTGDILKHHCGDVNNLGEVTAQFQAAGEASKDMVCSTQ